MDVRTICLGILTRGNATGYEIKKRFEEDGFEYFVEASFGSIYPALSRLTHEGLVSVREETQEKRPDRKVYSISDAGRSAFATTLLKTLPEDRYRSPFLFAMLFADQLPNPHVRQMVDKYTAYAEAKLLQLQQSKTEPRNKGERFVRDFGSAMYIAMLDYLHNHRNDFETAVVKAAE